VVTCLKSRGFETGESGKDDFPVVPASFTLFRFFWIPIPPVCLGGSVREEIIEPRLFEIGSYDTLDSVE